MKRRREFIVGITVVAAVIAVTAGAIWLSQTSLSRAFAKSAASSPVLR